MGLRKNKSLVDQALEQAQEYVEAARPHVESALDQAREFVNDTAIPALQDAADKAGPVLVDAREKAAPIVADARDRAAAGLSDARDAAVPLVTSGAAVAATKASAVRDLADAKVAELKGEKPRRSKLKTFVVIAAVAGAAAVVAKRLQGDKASDNWQSSYTPTPPPASPATPAAAPVATPAAPQSGADDPGGASPDEALSDAAEGAPHAVTTPDDPAEVVDLDPPKN
jgi:hypothetical protein